MKRYVGIDPSTKCGLVILKDGEVRTALEIKTKVEEDPQRFMDIAAQIRRHILETDIIYIEGFSYGSKGRGVSTQYGIGWLIRVELLKNGYSYTDVPPTSLKKFASGKGNTKKDALVLPIYKRWGFESNSDNIRDAYVLAQIAQSLHEDIELTAFQKEALKKIV
ncbi:hypothetical protein [Peribacillus simplex]|uniref:Holliday junction nuclease RuvC n=1 Tax=Peribacillus simplex TaxID=1478 RepID=A0A9W4KV09_9BACI|nr:hypothetical protein [Peribacillus simplex]CAH0186781.1 hypothetical protein SRABI133_01565 [Peribacillus simplex]